MDKISNFVVGFSTEHPNAYLAACTVGGLIVSIPLCIASYKYLGKVAGKAAAKELVKSGLL